MFYFDNHIYCTYMYTYYLATSSVRRYNVLLRTFESTSVFYFRRSTLYMYGWKYCTFTTLWKYFRKYFRTFEVLYYAL